MKTFTKHILLLALMLFGVAGAAWAQQQEKLLTTVTATGQTTYSQSPDGIVTVTLVNTYEYYGTWGWLSGSVTVEALQGYAITRCVFKQNPGGNPNRMLADDLAPFTATIDENDYSLHAETSTGDVIGGYYMDGVSTIEVYGYEPDPYAPALDETTGHWNFLMPGSNKVVKAVLYDSIVLGPHVEIYDASPAFAAGDIYHRGDSTIYYYDTNNHHSFYLRADEQADGKYFGFWSDLDPTDYYYTDRTYRRVSTGSFTCGQRFTAAYPNNYTLNLNPSAGGTLSLDGETPGETTYNISIDDNTYTNVSFPFQNMVFLQEGLDEVYNEGLSPLSIDQQLGNYVVITISEPYDGGRTIQYSCGGGEGGAKTIFCTAVQGAPIMPYGISANNDGTYSVMEGLTVNVTATPDPAHYLARIDGHDTVGNYATGYSFVMPSSNKDLEATFNDKPTLTLASNDIDQGLLLIRNERPKSSLSIGDTLRPGDYITGISSILFQGNVLYNGEIHAFYNNGFGCGSVLLDYNCELSFFDGDYLLRPAIDADHPGNAWVVYNITGSDIFLSSTIASSQPIVNNVTASTQVGPGTDVTIVALPADNHHLQSWSNGYNSTSTTQSITMGTADSSVTAIFDRNPFQVAARANRAVGGTVSAQYSDYPDGNAATEAAAASISFVANPHLPITLTATPAEGFHFTCWTSAAGDTLGTGITLSVTDDADVVAVFDINTYTVTLAANNGQMGSVAIESVVGPANNIGEITLYENNQTTSASTPTYTVAYYNFTRSQYIIPAADLADIPAGTSITGLKYYLRKQGTTFPVTTPVPVDVYMAEVEPATYTSSSPYPIAKETSTMVHQGTLSAVDAGEQGEMTIEFSQPYIYNGGDLVIGMENSEKSTTGIAPLSFYSTNFSGVRCMVYGSNSTYENIGRNWVNYRPMTTLSYVGNSVTDNGDGTYTVAHGTQLTVKATPDPAHYLANFDGTDVRNDNDTATKVYTITSDLNATANFAAKPVLTLASNDGGTLEAIIPSGAPTTAQLNVPASWDEQSPLLTPSDLPGFQPMTEAEARAWTGVPATGNGMLFYAYNADNSQWTALQYGNGSFDNNPSTYTWSRGDLHYSHNSYGAEYYYTTGATAANVIASTTEPNTYYIDYNTSVTVKATPSDTAYLVRFDQDADTNSNTAVEKTYGPLTAALTTATATFNAKPVLTLAASDTTWGKVTLAGAGLSGDYTLTLTCGNNSYTINNYTGDEITLTESLVQQELGAQYFSNASNTNSSNDYMWVPMIGMNEDAVLHIHNIFTTSSLTYSYGGKVSTYVTISATCTPNFTLPAGVVSANATADTFVVDYGTTLTVQADATELHHVANWVDADSVAYPADSITYSDYFVTEPEPLFPAHSTLRLTVTADATAKALFGINSYDVFARVDTTEDVRGTVRAEYIDIDGVSQSVAADDTVTYTAQGGSLSLVIATPTEPGYHFERWTDTLGTELGTNDTLEVTEAAAVIAVFDTNVYQISGTVAEGSEEWGEVTGSGDYRHFTQATLEALPIEHYHFVKWEDGNTENPRVIDVVGPESHQAEFAIDRFIVSWSSNDEAMGHVVGPYDNHTTGAPIPRLRGAWGTTFQLVAQPAEHHMLDYWSSGQTTDTIQHTITENAELVAYFKHVPYIVTVLSEDETMGTVAGTDTLEWQESTEISATANYGYHFTMWNDGVTDNPRTVVNNIESDQTFTASFAKNEYTVTVVSADETMGSVSGTDTVEYLDEIEISATANEHYHFVQWNDGNSDNPRTVSVTKNETYTATFAPNVYTLTLGSNNAIMGTVALTAPAVTPNADGSYSIAYGTAVTVKGSASSRCFELGSWSDGAVVTADGSHSFSMAGNLVLTATFVNHLFRSDTVADVCDRFVWHGIAYTETPDVAPLHRLTTVDGCDSALVLNLTVRHSSTGVDEQVHCMPYTWIDGVTYSESNHTAQYILPGANAEQCDSIVTLDLTIGTQAESTEVVNACDSYEWHGVVYTETPAEAPTYTYHTLEGCDSTVTLQLTIGHPTEGIETIVACAPIEWHGTVYSESTDEPTWHTTNAAGCDSTVTLHLTVNHSTAAVETVVACNSYEWHGVSYASSTTVPTYTTTGSNGCDSTTTLNLTIKQSSRATETVVTCDEYEWHGVLFTETPVEAPTYTTEGSNGCDSTVTLNLTVNHSADVVETIGACAAIEWHGTVYSESTTEPTWHSTTVAGCDSTVTLHLTISDRIETEETVVACDSYEWHGVVYTASTDNATWSTTSIQGCDSTVTLHLTINRSTTGSETIEACESYEWHGVTYRQSGSYTFDTLNVAGCDSTVTLTLTLHQPTSGSEFVTTCGSYVWHEVTYTQSGAYVWHGTDVHGCDSTVTLLLTILQPVYSTENRTACNSYTWHGTEYSESGDYTWSTTAVSGCDSIVTLHLTINLPVTSDVEESACERYTWNGIVYSTSGDYVQTFTGVNGCDSTVTLHLTVNMPATETLGVTACDSYEWHEVTYTESGVYSWHGTTVAGCDSTATLNLTIGHSADTTISLQGEGSIVWNGETFTQSGTYERVIRTVLGCDSTVTLNLVILPEGFVMPYLYNIMDVVLTINHFQQGETNLQYHWYRWYRNGKMVAEGRAMDTYSEGGSKLNGVYYLEVAIDESLEYWVRSNEVTIGTVGIDEAEDIDFTVAPNPVMHGSTVSVAVEGADVQGAVISVYDVQGREVLRQQNSAFIEAPAASGMYMVRLTLNDGRTAVKRLIVK